MGSDSPTAPDALFAQAVAAHLTGVVVLTVHTYHRYVDVHHVARGCGNYCDSDQELEAMLRGDHRAWWCAPSEGQPGATHVVIDRLLGGPIDDS